MITFSNFLAEVTQIDEAVRATDFNRVAELIRRYLTKSVGKIYYYPSPETFKSSASSGIGIKMFVGDGRAIRLNWSRTGGIKDSASLVSLDYWDGSKTPQPNPSNHIKFEGNQSLVKTLPFIRDYLLGKVKIKSGIFFDDKELNAPIAEDYLSEAAITNEDLHKTLSNVINGLKSGIQLRAQYNAGGTSKYGPGFNRVCDELKRSNPGLFKKEGVAFVITQDDAKKIDPGKVFAALTGSALPSSGSSFTVAPGTPEVVDVPGTDEDDIERMTYEEQLDSIKTGLKLMISNATNSLWVGGRGGTGKTETIEQVLASYGKTDGDGYFKITGSASPIGIYKILLDYHDQIILFDDSDSALADTEGRNLFKAASDTKKNRKISWMKGGSKFVDPDDWDEDADDGTLPRYFSFTGKIIFISNLPLNKLDPCGALRTRGYVMNVDPTNEEIYDFMYKIANKIKLDVAYKLSDAARIDVIEVLKTRKITDKTANLRSLVRGLNTRAAIELQGGSSDEWIKFVKKFA